MHKVTNQRRRSRGGKRKGQNRHDTFRNDALHAETLEPINASRGTKYSVSYESPLRRFLQASVGRLWNTVFSDICRQFPAGSFVRKRVMDLVWQHVELEADGAVWAINSWGKRQRLVHGAIYICPRTGLLMMSDYRWKPKPHNPTVRPLGNNTECRKLGDVWYQVTFCELPQRGDKAVFDVVLGLTIRPDPDPAVTRQLHETYGCRDRFAKHKRRMSAEEIQRLERGEQPFPVAKPTVRPAPGGEFRKIGSTWYFVRYDTVPATTPVYDVVKNQYLTSQDGTSRYASDRRQLSQREIKRYRLE